MNGVCNSLLMICERLMKSVQFARFVPIKSAVVESDIQSVVIPAKKRLCQHSFPIKIGFRNDGGVAIDL